jgi:hypothetical protein
MMPTTALPVLIAGEASEKKARDYRRRARCTRGFGGWGGSAVGRPRGFRR